MVTAGERYMKPLNAKLQFEVFFYRSVKINNCLLTVEMFLNNPIVSSPHLTCCSFPGTVVIYFLNLLDFSFKL